MRKCNFKSLFSDGWNLNVMFWYTLSNITIVPTQAEPIVEAEVWTLENAIAAIYAIVANYNLVDKFGRGCSWLSRSHLPNV